MAYIHSVFEYSSFRAYLRDIFQSEKAESGRVTLSSFAKLFGLSGPALQMILTGSRNLTLANTHRIARALKLRDLELDFFEALVLREQAETKEVRRYYAKRLVTLSQQSGTKRVRLSERKILGDWRVPALLIYLIDFVANLPEAERKAALKKFAKNLALSESSLVALTSYLESSGIISSSPGGGIHIEFDRLASRVTQKQYVKSIIQEMVHRVDSDFDLGAAIFRAFVVAVPVDDIEALRDDIVAAVEKRMAMQVKPTGSVLP